jgi:hypothetical protein
MFNRLSLLALALALPLAACGGETAETTDVTVEEPIMEDTTMMVDTTAAIDGMLDDAAGAMDDAADAAGDAAAAGAAVAADAAADAAAAVDSAVTE